MAFQVTLHLTPREFDFLKKGENFQGTIQPNLRLGSEINFIPVLVDAERLKNTPLTPNDKVQVYGRNQF